VAAYTAAGQPLHARAANARRFALQLDESLLAVERRDDDGRRAWIKTRAKVRLLFVLLLLWLLWLMMMMWFFRLARVSCRHRCSTIKKRAPHNNRSPSHRQSMSPVFLHLP
jgi:hypothetical protein